MLDSAHYQHAPRLKSNPRGGRSLDSNREVFSGLLPHCHCPPAPSKQAVAGTWSQTRLPPVAIEASHRATLAKDKPSNRLRLSHSPSTTAFQNSHFCIPCAPVSILKADVPP